MSSKHEQDEFDQRGRQDVMTGADGTVLLTLPNDVVTNERGLHDQGERPRRRRSGLLRTRPGCGSGAGRASSYSNQNTQAQIVADKKTYQVGDVADLLLVSGVGDAWAVVTAEGGYGAVEEAAACDRDKRGL